MSPHLKPDDIIIPFLVVSVGQACNFRCKDCGNFAPFAPKDTLRYDMGTIIRDLDTIIKYARIELLQIQGGEPFLHPQLEELLVFVRKCRAISLCQIATNGTVLPQVSPQSLTGEKFLVRISNYPVQRNASEQVEKWLIEHSIRMRIYHFQAKTDKWYYLGKNCTDDTDVEKRFQTCAFHECITMENGYLGHCSRAAIAQRVQNFTEPTGLLPILDRTDFKEKLYQYIHMSTYMGACIHCNGTNGGPMVPPAIQLKPGETWKDL
jgi:organic radical activating enzyme